MVDEPDEGVQPDRSVEDAVRRVFDDLSREEFGEPTADVLAVWRDDELLDWLAADDLDTQPDPPRGQDPADHELVELLVAWRLACRCADDELTPVEASPASPLAPADVVAGNRQRASRITRLPLVTVLLTVLLTVVALGVATQRAVPGDVLWNVSQVVNSRRAESIAAAQQTQRELDAAAAAIAAGRSAAAATALDAAARSASHVLAEHGLEQLRARQQDLAAEATRSAPSPPRPSQSAQETADGAAGGNLRRATVEPGEDRRRPPQPPSTRPSDVGRASAAHDSGAATASHEDQVPLAARIADHADVDVQRVGRAANRGDDEDRLAVDGEDRDRTILDGHPAAQQAAERKGRDDSTRDKDDDSTRDKKAGTASDGGGKSVGDGSARDGQHAAQQGAERQGRDDSTRGKKAGTARDSGGESVGDGSARDGHHESEKAAERKGHNDSTRDNDDSTRDKKAGAARAGGGKSVGDGTARDRHHESEQAAENKDRDHRARDDVHGARGETDKTRNE